MLNQKAKLELERVVIADQLKEDWTQSCEFKLMKLRILHCV